MILPETKHIDDIEFYWLFYEPEILTITSDTYTDKDDENYTSSIA